MIEQSKREYAKELQDYIDWDSDAETAAEYEYDYPDWEGDHPDDIIAKARKEHGDRFAKELDNMTRGSYGGQKKSNWRSKDSLASKKKLRKTKTGRLNKADVKSRIRDYKGFSAGHGGSYMSKLAKFKTNPRQSVRFPKRNLPK